MTAVFGPPRQRRFPAEALAEALGSTSKTELARRCGVERSQMCRYIRDGLPEAAADRIAVRCGLHPAEVWADWFGAEA